MLQPSPSWSSNEQAQLQILSQHNQWKILLHVSGNKSFIRDPNFFFSQLPFDPYRELIATTLAFHQTDTLGDYHALCRFPARYQWLKKKLHWQDKDFPSPPCIAYRDYLNKVPATEIQLVFASENITSPTSMMGHVFLKLSGVTPDNYQAEHAVTYFTVLDSLNIPRIIYGNFTEGMLGIFALQPYRQIQSNYLNKENRNIWEYSLNLTSVQKNLLLAHIWEFKGIKSDYLFTQYNCATVTYYLLALNYPEIFEKTHQWVTPIDVVNQLKSNNLITKTNIVTSTQWKIQMLLDHIGNAKQISVGQLQNPSTFRFALKSLSPSNELLALAYIQYSKKSYPDMYQQHKKSYTTIEDSLAHTTYNYSFDYSNYKDPSLAPGNSQVQVSLGETQNNGFVDLSFLPAAIRLTDDQRQFFSAHELKIAELSARLYRHRLELNYFDIFSVKSLNPWNTFTRNISSEWRIALEPHFDNNMNSRVVLNLSAGMGYSFKPHQDILLSALYNIGAAADLNTSYIYHYPAVILQLNEMWDMKTTAYFQSNFNMYSSGLRNNSIKLCQSHYPSQNKTLLACFEQNSNPNKTIKTLKLSIQQHF